MCLLLYAKASDAPATPQGLSARNLLVADFKRKLSRPKLRGKAAWNLPGGLENQ
jgi:hypothetical protein